MKALTFKDALIEFEGKTFVGIDSTRFEQEINSIGEGEIEFTFLDTTLDLAPPMKADPTCECGSGSNVRGPGHSDYCSLLER